VPELVFRPSVEAMGGNPNSGASSDVAVRTDVASFGDNHFVRCDLLHHRVIHARARKALEAKALLQLTPTVDANGQASSANDPLTPAGSPRRAFRLRFYQVMVPPATQAVMFGWHTKVSKHHGPVVRPTACRVGVSRPEPYALRRQGEGERHQERESLRTPPPSAGSDRTANP
jgi:hypothetical protein